VPIPTAKIIINFNISSASINYLKNINVINNDIHMPTANPTKIGIFLSLRILNIIFFKAFTTKQLCQKAI